MKTRIVSLVLSALLLVSSFLLCGCSDSIGYSEAKERTESLISAINNRNWETAAFLFHPITDTDPYIIVSFISSVSVDTGVDLTKPITCKEFNGYSTHFTMYDSRTGKGGWYATLSFVISVDGRNLPCGVELMRNDDGFGFTNITIDPNES